MAPPLLFSHKPSPDPTKAYPPDLKKPIVAYRYAHEWLCGQVVVPFVHLRVPMAVDEFTDLRHDDYRLTLIPEPLHVQAALYAWEAALEAVADLRDQAREKGDEDATCLYTQAVNAIEARVNEMGLALFDMRPSARRYGS